MEALACCVAVSAKNGVDLVSIYPKSLNTTKYHEFLEKLRAKYKKRKICLYMDNLHFHKSATTREKYDQLRMTVVYNPPYSPFANPIEECFSVVKQEFKKAKINRIMNGTEY